MVGIKQEKESNEPATLKQTRQNEKHIVYRFFIASWIMSDRVSLVG